MAADWSFGPFQFDSQSGRLTKHGHRIKLQPKSATILSCLVENRGKVVSRLQLQEALWPDGTYVDFDLGIKVGVKRLRDALGDLSDEPTYIQTIYGEGYRFIAPASQVEPVPQSATVASRRPPQRGFSQKLLWAGGVAVLAVLAAVVLLAWVPYARPLNFQNRDWVVIAAFENRTGEKVLDGSMEFALERELSRSNYLNVAPLDRISDTLRMMRQKPDAVLTEDLARQVAVRDGEIKAVLAGRIEKFGPKYVLTVRAVSPASGETAATFVGEGKLDQLPAAARAISEQLRRRLGEPPARQALEVPKLEKATTPSLAALAAFSAGMRNVNELKWLPAAGLLEEAVRQDPQFALAHVYAAHCYSNLHEDDRAAPHYEAAYKLAGDVTVRERLFIQGSYYRHVLNDDRRSLASYEALVNLYPDDYWGANNLMTSYLRLGMRPETMRMRERLLAIRPNAYGYLKNLEDLWWYYRREQPDQAKARQYGGQLRRWRSDGSVRALQGSYYEVAFDLEAGADKWWKGDVEGAAREVARATAHAMARNDDDYTIPLATTNMVIGRLGQARELCGHMRDQQNRIECTLLAAYVSGDTAAEREQLVQLRIERPDHPARLAAMGIAISLGEIAAAKRWSDLRPGYEIGLLLLAEGHTREAIEDLRKRLVVLQPSGTASPFQWYRLALATALQQEGKVDEAIAQLQYDTRPGLANLVQGWVWPQCRLKLAELYRKSGRVREALLVEDEIRHFLSAADRDHPVLVRLATTQTRAAR